MLFSGCGVARALGKRSVPASPVLLRSSGESVKSNSDVARRGEEGLAVAHDLFDPVLERARPLGASWLWWPLDEIQSMPQSNGRTTRSFVTDARRRSQAWKKRGQHDDGLEDEARPR